MAVQKRPSENVTWLLKSEPGTAEHEDADGLQIDNKYSKGVTQRLTFDRKIAVILSKLEIFRDYEMRVSNDFTVPIMHFSTFLKGSYDHYVEDLGWLNLGPGETAYCRVEVEDCDNDYRIKACPDFDFVGYSFATELVGSFLGEDLPEDWRIFLNDDGERCHPTIVKPSPATLQIVQQMSRCPYIGRIREVHIEGLALQALAAHAAEYLAPAENSLSSIERKKVEEAREFLLHDMRNPPTLDILAKEVGLGSRKLSNGFKELYGEGPFAVLKGQRLDHARLALLEGLATIKEISWRVGYSHPNNFSVAYKERFGTNPSSDYPIRNE